MAEVEKKVVDEVKESVKQTKKTAAKTTKPTTKKDETKKREFKPTDLIMCKSVCYGELFLKGKKTGLLYSWAGTGDVREVEYQDLLSWKVLHSEALFGPLIMILDDELVNQWNRELGDIYRRIEDDDVSDLFESDYDEFVMRLKNLPNRVKETVKNIANSKIQDGTLYDLRKIKAMDEILDTELMMLVG